METCDYGTIGDLAGYSTLKLNITHIPIGFYMGLCLPKECSQLNQTQFSNNVSIFLNQVLGNLQKNFHLIDFSKGYGLIQPFTDVFFTLTSSQDAED